MSKIKTLFLDTRVLLALILLLGFTIRIWGMSTAETFHDEGLYAFRSIGYIDFIQNDDQTTPIQWFKDSLTLPWWTKLSFHDAPPLYFLIQYIFFRFFGDSLFVARLPSFVAGMFAIWLMFLIGRRLFFSGIEKSHYEQNIAQPDRTSLPIAGRHSNSPAGEYARSASDVNFAIPIADIAGLLAALFLSINHIHIWISRTSIIESLLITLMLANIYFFLRFVNLGSRAHTWESDSKANWIWFGTTFGLILLTKYTGIVLVLIYFLYLLIFHRDYFKKWQLYASVGLAIILFSPVIIYNIYLYKTIHHFDLQLAYLFGQQAPEWRASLGKVLDSFVSSFVPNMFAMYSKQFLFVVVAGLLIITVLWRKSRLNLQKTYFILCAGILFITLLLTKIGVGIRFLPLYIPFAVFVIVLTVLYFFYYIKSSIIKIVIITVFVLSEIWFSIGGIFIEFPSLGVVATDQYLSSVLGPDSSIAIFESPNPHLNLVTQQYAAKMPKGYRRKLLVYDNNIVISTRLWLFARRRYYHGIPAITAYQLKQLFRERGVESFSGYEIYFVKVNEDTLLFDRYGATRDANELEDFLKKELNLSPIFTSYSVVPQFGGGLKAIPSLMVYKIIL